MTEDPSVDRAEHSAATDEPLARALRRAIERSTIDRPDDAGTDADPAAAASAGQALEPSFAESIEGATEDRLDDDRRFAGIESVPVPHLENFPPAPAGASSATAPGRQRKAASTRFLAMFVLGLLTFLVFIQLRPDLLFSSATPTGGDNAAHVATGEYVKRVLIPEGRIYGWTMTAFAGLPVLNFYFPLPTLLIVALSYILPYTVAFKIVTVIGILGLPWAVYWLGRKAELRWPEPLFLAVGTFPFLLLRHYKILGGNIMSTMAGEFSFSVSLLLTVLYMGSLIRLLRSGGGRTRTAALLAGLALCHVVPTLFAIFFTIASVLCETDRPVWKRQVRDLAWTGIVAVAVTAFWTVPFLHNLPYTNSMDYERNTRTLRTLFPILPKSATLHTPADNTAQASVFVVLMLITIAVGFRRRDRFIASMTIAAFFSAIAFAVWPRSAMWNNRLLPSWFFCVYTLGAIGVWHVGSFAARQLRRRTAPKHSAHRDAPGVPVESLTPTRERTGGPVALASLTALAFLGPAFVSTTSHLPFGWAAGNFTGSEGRKSFPEYKNLVNVLKTLPCGRLFTEPDPKRYEKYGSTLSMMALPYWTNDCIQTIDGLYFEASQTTPFHYLTSAMVSSKASRAQRRLPYMATNLAEGVDRLRQLGVRYMLTGDDASKAAWRKRTDLRSVATSGPYEVFEIRDAATVIGLSTEPVLMTGVNPRELGAFTDVALAKWVRPTTFPSVVAIDGPSTWLRFPITLTPSAPATPAAGTHAKAMPVEKAKKPTRGDGLAMLPEARAEERTVEPAKISNVEIGKQTIGFDSDRLGTPVLIRVSWFPNWRAHGADGPYRVAPNFMVVIPRTSHVELSYEYTRLELGAFAVSGVGFLVLVRSARRSRSRRRKQATETTPPRGK